MFAIKYTITIASWLIVAIAVCSIEAEESGRSPYDIYNIISIKDDSDATDSKVDDQEGPTETDEQLEERLVQDEILHLVQETPEGWTEHNKIRDPMQIYWGTYHSGAYKEINKVLAEKVPEGSSPEENVQFAMDWLEHINKKNSYLIKHLIQALTQFTSLATLNSSNMCNRDSYAILFKNSKAVSDRAHVSRNNIESLRRIDSVIRTFLLRHAIECVPKYPMIFKKVYSLHDHKSVEIFQDAMIKARREHATKWLALKKRFEEDSSDYAIAIDTKSFKEPYEIQVAFDVIGQLGADDSNISYLHKVLDPFEGGWIVDKKKVEELVQKYLVSPCEKLVLQLGTNVFIPLRFDMAMLDDDDINDLHQEGLLDDPEYNMGFARYKLCKVLIRKKNSLVKSMVYTISKKERPDFY